jgi:hypothetical protein
MYPLIYTGMELGLSFWEEAKHWKYIVTASEPMKHEAMDTIAE